MWRKVARKEKPVAGWSFAVILYVLSGSLCVSYPLLAPISGWAQGTNPASLECCRNVDKLMQFYYTSLLHEHILENEFMDKLVSCDAFSPALQPISKRKKGCLKKINVRGFFISLFTFICSAGSTVLSFLLLLFGLGTMKATLSLFVISLCMTLVVFQCKLFYHVVTVNTQVVNHECVQERGNQHTHAIFWKIVVCVTVYAKVYFSRAIFNLRVLISTLLLMSGDVETNPGPPADNPPKSPTDSGDISPTHSTLSQSSLDSISESVRSNHSSNSLPHSSVSAKAVVSSQVPKPEFSKPVSEEGVHSSGESAVRKQMTLTNDSQLQFVHTDTTNAHILRENVDGAEETDLTDTLRLVAQTKPELAAKHEKGKSRLVPPTFPKLPQSEDNTHAAVQIQDQEREEQHFVYILNSYHTRHRRTSSHDGAINKTKSEVMPCLDLKRFHDANQKYLLQQRHGQCPMCWTEFKKPSRSHIIPAGVLKVFKRIWCSNNENQYKDFIYHFEKKTTMTAKKCSQQLLCPICEEKCSTEEQKLRELYISIMHDPDSPGFKVPNEECWFLYVLANIMFRGLLVNVDLSEHNILNNEHFVKVFTILWKYCFLTKTERQLLDSRNVPDLRIFLLSSKPFLKTEVNDFTQPVERLLRNPQFTTLHKVESRTFLYCKFDCFHVVLPINMASKQYFDQYDNGYTELEGSFTLQWTEPTIPLKHFPEMLFRLIFPDYERFIQQVHEEEHKIRRHSVMLVDKTKLQGSKKQEVSPSQIIKYDCHTDVHLGLKENEYSKMIEEASASVLVLQCSTLRTADWQNDELKNCKAKVTAAKIKQAEAEEKVHRVTRQLLTAEFKLDLQKSATACESLEKNKEKLDNVKQQIERKQKSVTFINETLKQISDEVKQIEIPDLEIQEQCRRLLSEVEVTQIRYACTSYLQRSSSS